MRAPLGMVQRIAARQTVELTQCLQRRKTLCEHFSEHFSERLFFSAE
jgi:hypothetical protein